MMMNLMTMTTSAESSTMDFSKKDMAQFIPKPLRPVQYNIFNLLQSLSTDRGDGRVSLAKTNFPPLTSKKLKRNVTNLLLPNPNRRRRMNKNSMKLLCNNLLQVHSLRTSH